MRIGIDISRIAATARTGTEQYTYELLAALARMDRRTTYWLYCNELPAQLPPLGTNFTLRRVPLSRLWTHVRLSAEVLVNPPDLLFIPAHVIPLAAPIARRTRSIVTIHDLGYLYFPAAHTRAQRLQLRLTTAWSARVATHVIAISHATKADLIRLAHIPTANISVVHHGVSTRFQPPALGTGSAPTPGSQMSDHSPYFLYVGTIQPRKNLVRLIEAFALALPRLGRQRLIIAGRRGWLSQPIEQRATELGVADRVEFCGYVEDAQLPQLLSGATAFVFPSLYEGFGMPVLEAMACGVPVMTSNTSALPEVSGDAALLIDPGDTQAIVESLVSLGNDPALRSDLQRRGLEHVRTFTWDRCAQETIAVFQQTAAKQLNQP